MVIVFGLSYVIWTEHDLENLLFVLRNVTSSSSGIRNSTQIIVLINLKMVCKRCCIIYRTFIQTSLSNLLLTTNYILLILSQTTTTLVTSNIQSAALLWNSEHTCASCFFQAVYGVLSGLEGLDAFQDLMTNTSMKPWYERVRQAVQTHAGAHTLWRSLGASSIHCVRTISQYWTVWIDFGELTEAFDCCTASQQAVTWQLLVYSPNNPYPE